MNEVKDVSQSNSFSCNNSAHASSVKAPAQQHGRPGARNDALRGGAGLGVVRWGEAQDKAVLVDIFITPCICIGPSA